jgi:xanthine dehydrogenase small subunit
MASPLPPSRIEKLVAANIIPDLFLGIAEKLAAIPTGNCSNPHNQSPVIVGGGTDIYVQKADQMLKENLKFISHPPNDTAIITDGDRIIIDAAATTEQLMNATVFTDIFPAWQKSFRLISSQMIRNRATVGGNIVNASPIGDISIMLLALNASLLIQSGSQTREIALKNFYKGYKQLDLQNNEQILQIIVPLPAPTQRFNFEKVSKRRHLDIASVNSAILIEEDDGKIITARISAGGIGPIPTYLSKASATLSGSPLNSATIKSAATAAAGEVMPISDVRGSADYKTALLKRLIIAHFSVLFPDSVQQETIS